MPKVIPIFLLKNIILGMENDIYLHKHQPNPIIEWVSLDILGFKREIKGFGIGIGKVWEVFEERKEENEC